MKILKFGGTSVKNAENIGKVLDIIQEKFQNGKKIAVVCSAMGGITDLLIRMSTLAADGDEEYQNFYNQFKDRHEATAKTLLGNEKYTEITNVFEENLTVLKNLLNGIKIVREVSPRTMDYVLSFGERNSNFLIANALAIRGIDAAYLDARKIIHTNKEFGAAKIDFEATNKKIRDHFSSCKNTIQIITGFIASDKGGLTTTLGRGGSDYTVSIIGAALNVDAIEIWTDVDGVLTTDPRIVNDAFTIDNLSYVEAMEMSHFGAKVIYPPTIKPAMENKIPIYIKNTFNPSHPGTRIHLEPNNNSSSAIKGISALGDIVLVNIEGSGMMGVAGFSNRLFSILAKASISIILIFNTFYLLRIIIH